MQISKVVSANLKESDIHHCTRVAKLNREDKRPRSIIVKFGTPLLRDTFLANTIKFNKEHHNDKLNTSHIGIAGNKKPIYILEHLSPKTRNYTQRLGNLPRKTVTNSYGLSKERCSFVRQNPLGLSTLEARRS
ncbi:unnamed protein product [Euphydryas editha]|uniref:Uncharacterized protein n=1 Tax=Euphydryas editha TaxID=104508 RepID=A0AAU9UFF1_EUPED|nr:unnamed protein product [Euphydryas editha]